MSFSDINHQVTGDQLPVAARAYWTQVAASHALRRRAGALEHTPEGYECCSFCMRNVPLDSMMREMAQPICVCCVVESVLNPPEDKEDAKVWPPSYALALLEESRFAERMPPRTRSWSDLTEQDIEDPETGRYVCTVFVDRITREEVDPDECIGPSPCRGCNYVRILGWGEECDGCREMMLHERVIGAALASAAW